MNKFSKIKRKNDTRVCIIKITDSVTTKITRKEDEETTNNRFIHKHQQIEMKIQDIT